MATYLRGVGLFILISASLIYGAPAQAQSSSDKPTGVQVTGAELTKMMSRGALIEGYNPNESTWYAHVYLNGGNLLSIQVRSIPFGESGGIGESRKGKWRSSGDMLCIEIEPVPIGAPCRNVYRLSDGSYEFWTQQNLMRISSFRLHGPDHP
jgi:hypothetical protein